MKDLMEALLLLVLSYFPVILIFRHVIASYFL
jgi:hypothetical protein